MTILRRIGAVIAGLIVAFLLVSGAEGIAHKIYPPPPGTNMQDMTQVKAYVATLPLSVMLVVLTGWLIATFVATWLAARIAGTSDPRLHRRRAAPLRRNRERLHASRSRSGSRSPRS